MKMLKLQQQQYPATAVMLQDGQFDDANEMGLPPPSVFPSSGFFVNACPNHIAFPSSAMLRCHHPSGLVLDAPLCCRPSPPPSPLPRRSVWGASNSTPIVNETPPLKPISYNPCARLTTESKVATTSLVSESPVQPSPQRTRVPGDKKHKIMGNSSDAAAAAADATKTTYTTAAIEYERVVNPRAPQEGVVQENILQRASELPQHPSPSAQRRLLSKNAKRMLVDHGKKFRDGQPRTKRARLTLEHEERECGPNSAFMFKATGGGTVPERHILLAPARRQRQSSSSSSSSSLALFPPLGNTKQSFRARATQRRNLPLCRRNNKQPPHLHEKAKHGRTFKINEHPNALLLPPSAQKLAISSSFSSMSLNQPLPQLPEVPCDINSQHHPVAVEEIRQGRDVLLGRGGSLPVVNQWYRDLLSRYRVAYCTAVKGHKRVLVKQLTNYIRVLGGRFLEKHVVDKNANSAERGGTFWFEVGDERAILKVSQGLREGTAAILRVTIQKQGGFQPREANGGNATPPLPSHARIGHPRIPNEPLLSGEWDEEKEVDEDSC